MEVIVTTEEKLRTLIAEAVASVLKGLPVPAPAISEPEQPITDAEAQQLVKRSRQALYSWRREGLITAHNFNGRLFYFRSELLEALRREARR